MTPIRRQYLKIKGEHPDAILLFRMGDFYETFDDDAVLAAKELEITLTSRSMGKGFQKRSSMKFHPGMIEDVKGKLTPQGWNFIEERFWKP